MVVESAEAINQTDEILFHLQFNLTLRTRFNIDENFPLLLLRRRRLFDIRSFEPNDRKKFHSVRQIIEEIKIFLIRFMFSVKSSLL